MSFYATNVDYVISSNNSVNENSANTKKVRSTKYQLKQLLKPLLAVIRNNKKHNTYRKAAQPEFYPDEDDSYSETDDNIANELLENRILKEIDYCQDYAGVPVYVNGHMDIMPVFRGQNYIPVNFAKTEAGTFFWTSMLSADADVCCHGDRNPITKHQAAELQASACDRWAQA